MPEAILYIIYGFLFLRVFRLKTVTSKTENSENTLLSSLVIGFIIYKVMEFIPCTTKSNIVDALIICIVSVVGGYFLAIIYKSNIVQRIINDKLHIHKTMDNYIWDVIIAENRPIFIKIKTQNNELIEGFINLVEDNTDDPHISIGNYSISNVDTKEVIKKASENELLMFDLKRAEYYEIVFHKESIPLDLQRLNNNNREDYIKSSGR